MDCMPSCAMEGVLHVHFTGEWPHITHTLHRGFWREFNIAQSLLAVTGVHNGSPLNSASFLND